MPLIASHWYPSLNPVGWWSLTAGLISAAVWFLVQHRIFRTERAHGWLAVIAPLVLLAFVVHSKVRVDASPLGLGYGWPYRFPDAQDYIADYVFVAVALILAWKAARLRAIDLRVIGIVDLVLASAFLALESVFLYQRFYAG